MELENRGKEAARMENMELLQAMRQMLSENNRQMTEEMNRQMAENNRQMMEEMNRQMAENNRQMMEEMNRQMSENNRQMMEEMHTQIQDAVAPIYSRLDKVDARLDKVDARLDKVESELQSVKALATKTQLIVENEIDRKINLLLEGHNDLHRRVVQLEQMNEILNEVKNDVWAIKQTVAGRVVPYKSRGIRRKPNM